MELKELQNIELNILKEFDIFCKNNKLDYYLTGGTLIGAVRHKGFIPWDDDIDLVMKRNDYAKLIKTWNNNNNRYKLLSLYNEKEYFYPFIKIVDTKYICYEYNNTIKNINYLGPWIDIFPIDNYSIKINLRKILWINKKRLYSSIKKLHFGETCKKRPYLIPIRFLIYLFWRNPRKYALKIDKLAQKCKDKTNQLYAGTSGVGKRDIFESWWFDKTINLKFEDSYFPAPIGYKEYLERRYGDYMTPPPESERNINHGMIIKENDKVDY